MTRPIVIHFTDIHGAQIGIILNNIAYYMPYIFEGGTCTKICCAGGNAHVKEPYDVVDETINNALNNAAYSN